MAQVEASGTAAVKSAVIYITDVEEPLLLPESGLSHRPVRGL